MKLREFCTVVRNGKVVSCAFADQAIALQADVDNEIVFSREVSPAFEDKVKMLVEAARFAIEETDWDDCNDQHCRDKLIKALAAFKDIAE